MKQEHEEYSEKWWQERIMAEARHRNAQDIRAHLSRYSWKDGVQVWGGILGVLVVVLVIGTYLSNLSP